MGINMFKNLSVKLTNSLQKIGVKGRLTEDNIKNTLSEVRTALLEADVALPLIKELIKKIKEKSLGQTINKSLTPGQEFIKIVYNELIRMVGDTNNILNLSTQPPAIIMIIGPLGTGKTTTVAKLGKFLRKKYNKKVLAVSIDVYRPAAIKQLEILSKKSNIDFFVPTSQVDYKPIDIATLAIQEAKIKFFDILLIDTAGCLHTNKKMMSEIKSIYTNIVPIENLFVMDAMSGQDAINVAQSFNEFVPISGVILTKVDSDARGGVALSIRYITNKSIKFIGVGEKIDDLELFNPERLVKRILGMNDMLSFIQDIENKIDHQQANKLAFKLRNSDVFNFNDFLKQLKQIQTIDNIANLINKVPGIGNVLSNKMNLQMDNKALIKIEAIINSMTVEERINPNLIKGSHKRRIALGSGTEVQDINKLLNQFIRIQHVMKKIKKGGIGKIISNMKNMQSLFFFNN